MRLRDKTDTDLITLIIHDDEAAFSELYIRYKDKLHYFCLSLLKSEEETNDIVQEILSACGNRAFSSIQTFPFLPSFIRWPATGY